MKKADLVTSLSLVPVDYVMLVAAGITSYSLRYQSFVTQFRPVFFDYPFASFFSLLLLISVVGIIIFALGGSYRISSHVRVSELFAKSFMGVSTTLLLIIVTIFLQRELFSSRFIIIIAWILGILFVFIGRILVFNVKSKLLKRGVGVHYFVILGDTKAASDITDYFSSRPQLGYRLKRVFADFSEQTMREIVELSNAMRVDEIIDTRPDARTADFADVANFSHEHNISYRYLAHSHHSKMVNVELDSIAGYPIIQVHRTPLDGWGKILKRAMDIMIGTVLIIVLSPLLIIIAVCIRIDSKGPIFVRLNRVGRGGKIFKLYKFRSMIPNAHELKNSMLDLNERKDGPLFKVSNDPRVTRLGKILRKTSIDELPQLWNVMRGEMSLVGPRPHEPEEVAHYQSEDRALIGAKPGITGLAQVSGRSNLLFSEEVALEISYIENWSLRLDIKILARTFLVVFKFREAV